MNENQIWVALCGPLGAAIQALWGVEVAVKQRLQPNVEGIDTGPTLYLVKLPDVPVGSPKRDAITDPDAPTGPLIRRETQIYLSTIQAMAILKDTAENVSGPTASDIANWAGATIRSDYFMDELRAAGLTLTRVGETRNVQFVNGSDQNEASPSFDFVLTHNQVTLSRIPAVSAMQYRQYPV